MAKIEGKDFKTGAKAFSLAPVKVAGQDATEYTLLLWHHADVPPQTYTFSVAGWQMGQDDVWVLARAFAETPALLEATLPMDLWRTGRPQRACLCVSADWLHVTLCGNPKQQKVRIVLYIKEGTDPEIFRRVFIQTDVEQARRFGLELEQEIIEAAPEWASERELRR